MQGKSSFIDRVISRSSEWQCRFPALIAAAHDNHSISSGRQVGAAATSDAGIRCVFFSAHGSLLDFAATWPELRLAQSWWHFVSRWNFFLFASEHDVHSLENALQAPVHSRTLSASHAPLPDGDAFLAFLDQAETAARYSPNSSWLPATLCTQPMMQIAG
jgi:hypothetical protein